MRQGKVKAALQLLDDNNILTINKQFIMYSEKHPVGQPAHPDTLALVAKRICTTLVDPLGLAPLTAYRLIALDKSPGVNPIGVGKTVRHIHNRLVHHTRGYTRGRWFITVMCWTRVRK